MQMAYIKEFVGGILSPIVGASTASPYSFDFNKIM